MWQTIRSFHLAGRCIGCNECERVCPVDIPLSLLNRKLEKDVKELFAFQAGLDPEEQPHFATFKKEKNWSSENEFICIQGRPDSLA